ncbi:benzoquinone reductase [Amanita thiersii Skay4041]|uniref:Benzoquinone reductase n=1 Tax=Amanita thiersii Skay4041 TaxID=703135 RepID=A0A2A9NMG0_9AGAR|nr:benzoquinone reductase [Amanita thiersii Skay4041]
MCFPTKSQKNNFNDNSGQKQAEKKETTTPAAPEVPMSSPRVAIIIYSMYGHIAKMAESVKAGITEAGGSVTIYQVPETLSTEILGKMGAPPKGNYPVIKVEDLPNFDAFMFGIPTRFGNMPGQWKAFWDATGGLWGQGSLAGKFAGVFVSSASLGGGQEMTALNTMSTLVHHGMIFVPLGYSKTFGQLTNVEEVHGGSPWGAGTLAAPNGSRQPSALELEIAKIHGNSFYSIVSKYKF